MAADRITTFKSVSGTLSDLPWYTRISKTCLVTIFDTPFFLKVGFITFRLITPKFSALRAGPFNVGLKK